MQVRGNRCRAIEIECDAFGRAADVGRIAVAFLGGEVKGRCFIGKQAANQALPVLYDPSAMSVAADDEAGRRCDGGKG